jgi:hypothetical protein
MGCSYLYCICVFVLCIMEGGIKGKCINEHLEEREQLMCLLVRVTSSRAQTSLSQMTWLMDGESFVRSGALPGAAVCLRWQQLVLTKGTRNPIQRSSSSGDRECALLSCPILSCPVLSYPVLFSCSLGFFLAFIYFFLPSLKNCKAISPPLRDLRYTAMATWVVWITTLLGLWWGLLKVREDIVPGHFLDLKILTTITWPNEASVQHIWKK